MLNTSRLIGGALGLAVLSTIAASRTRADLLLGASGPSALSSGFRLAFAVSAVLSLLGALVAVVLLRARPPAPERGLAARLSRLQAAHAAAYRVVLRVARGLPER